MISYDLAKELKDAGLLQKPLEETFDGTGFYLWGKDHGQDDDCYVPTLSELIEACGDEFWVLTKMVGEWQARKSDGYTEIGSTPEIAVARLYLTIHKKDEVK